MSTAVAERNVLLTGFGPFAGVPLNPSWQAVCTLVQETPLLDVGDCGHAVCRPADSIRVSYAAVDEAAVAGRFGAEAAAAGSAPPRLVVHVGVGKPGALRLEGVARNGPYEGPDCDGRRRPGGKCVPGAPAKLYTTIDTHRVCAKVAGATVEVSPSSDAGLYLCEYIYYRSLFMSQELGSDGPAVLFVHVPPLGRPYSANAVVSALRAVVRACLEQLVSQEGCQALPAGPPTTQAARAECMQCRRLCSDGRRGTGRHAGEYYCAQCWRAWGKAPKYENASVTHEDLRTNDGEWRQPKAEQKVAIRAYIEKCKLFAGPYVDAARQSAYSCTQMLRQPGVGHAWTLDYSPQFFAEVAYEGVFPMGGECRVEKVVFPAQVLVLCFDQQVSVLDFHEAHVSRQVRRHAKDYTMTVDTAFDDVLLGCIRMHGEAWLHRGYRWLLRTLVKDGYTGTRQLRFGVHSFELWDSKGQLVAGDLGYTIGGIYSSMTGFRAQHTKHAGEVQMVLTTALLHKIGFCWIDLGQVLEYKSRLGARTIARKEYMERLHRDRDRQTHFGHERVEGEMLLYHLLQVLQSGTDSSGGCIMHARDVTPADESSVEGTVAQAASPSAAERMLSSGSHREHLSCNGGRAWTVVGGRENGGLVVRAESALTSEQLSSRLETGAVVQELDAIGNRLSFAKISGRGPDRGWVSIAHASRPLLKPLDAKPGSNVCSR